MAEGQPPQFPALGQLSEEDYAALLHELMALRQGQAPNQAPPQVPHVAQMAGPVLLPKPPKPDPFRGGRKVASWLFTLEQYFTATGVINGGAKVAYTATLLRDTAADWWRGISLAAQARQEPVVEDWDDFKSKITAHFQPIHEEDFARQLIRSLKQQKTVREYVTRFQDIILQIPTMDERSKVDAFIAGLKQDVRRWVKLQDPRTLENAMSVAEKYQTMVMQDSAAMRAYKELSGGKSYHPGGSSGATPMDIGTVRANTSKGFSKQGREGRKPYQQRNNQSNVVRTCYNCGEPGHISRDCPRKQDARRSAKTNRVAIDEDGEEPSSNDEDYSDDEQSNA